MDNRRVIKRQQGSPLDLGTAVPCLFRLSEFRGGRREPYTYGKRGVYSVRSSFRKINSRFGKINITRLTKNVERALYLETYVSPRTGE